MNGSHAQLLRTIPRVSRGDPRTAIALFTMYA